MCGGMSSNDSVIHDFFKDVAWSESPPQYIRYMQAIVYWWPEIEEWDRITDLVHQKQGKDITISTSDSEQIRLQFKSRRYDYGDCLIEYRHDYHNGNCIPGWIEKESEIDYLIYCTPTWTYRVEWESITDAWDNHKEDWIKLYDRAPAPNSNYDTRNVAVSWEVLKRVGVELDSFRPTVGITSKATFVSTVHWPGWNEPYHPLWPKETLELWVKNKSGTKDQIERYKKDIAWYEENT